MVFNSSADYTVSAKLPSGITEAQAIALLHNHDFIIHCDENLSKYTDVTDSRQNKIGLVDASLKPVAKTKCYAVFDLVQNVPGGIWNSDVETFSEYTDLESGLFIRTRSPLSIQNETEWLVGRGELTLKTKIMASSILLPMIKGRFKENLDVIHASILKKLGKS